MEHFVCYRFSTKSNFNCKHLFLSSSSHILKSSPFPLQPSVCRQGGHDGWSSGDGWGDCWSQPCSCAGHQNQPPLCQRPQCGRGTALHGENIYFKGKIKHWRIFLRMSVSITLPQSHHEAAISKHRIPPFPGYLEHEHASDWRCDEIGSGRHGEEEPKDDSFLQTLNLTEGKFRYNTKVFCFSIEAVLCQSVIFYIVTAWNQLLILWRQMILLGICVQRSVKPLKQLFDKDTILCYWTKELKSSMCQLNSG